MSAIKVTKLAKVAKAIRDRARDSHILLTAQECERLARAALAAAVAEDRPFFAAAEDFAADSSYDLINYPAPDGFRAVVDLILEGKA